MKGNVTTNKKMKIILLGAVIVLLLGMVDTTSAQDVGETTQVLTTGFRSLAASDGYIWEATEENNRGFYKDFGETTIRVGDDGQDRQYRAILSFNTSTMPDDAIISKVRLKVMPESVVGTDPFTTHGFLRADIRMPYFCQSADLEACDFQATPDLFVAGTFPATLVNGFYMSVLRPEAIPYINLVGRTQFRLRFSLDDDDDGSADYIRFYSGNGDRRFHPFLMIYYTVP
jgi:hypothetical protein